MDFFFAQESLTTVQWILRAIVAFFFLLFATKMLGERSISQLRLIDFTMALILGNVLAQPLADNDLGLKGALVTTSMLIVLYNLSVFATLKWGKLRKVIEPSPFPLIKNGELIYQNIKKARITIDHLLSELRKSQIEEVQKVALAMWESDGSISFFLNPQHQVLTPASMNIITAPFSFPVTVVKEGRIEISTLQLVGKDLDWLQSKFINYNVKLPEVLLATVDSSENLRIYLYDIFLEKQ